MKFAKEGLRTLVVAKKNISEDEVRKILSEVNRINMSNKVDKTEELLDIYNEIEQNFNFIGASAIEDKLQDVINNF